MNHLNRAVMIKPGAGDPFQAVADPSRRQILHLLSGNRLTINAVSEHFDMSRPAVSKHIKILYSAGFITIEELGRERYCTLDKAGFAALQEWIRYFDGFWRGKLDALDKFLVTSSSQKPKALPVKPGTLPVKPDTLRSGKQKTTPSIQQKQTNYFHQRKK